MTAQPSFDFTAPIARRSDPPTSHRSAAEHTATGARGANAELLYAAIAAHPDLTCGELLDFSGLDRAECSKRLSDLHATFRIEAVAVRRCSVTGKNARTWRAR